MGIVRRAIERMEGYRPGEQPSDGKFIKLNTNENPYPPSPRVREALAGEAERLQLYPDPLAEALRERIAGIHGVPKERVIAGNGSDDVLTMVMRTFAERGDPVASPVPTYTLYETLCGIQGARYLPVPYREDYSLDPSAVPARAKVVFVANPNSPSGTLLPAATLSAIAGRIAGVLVVDEAYVDFARRDCLDLARRHENVIILRSLSKSFSLAGLRLGYGIAREEIVSNLRKVKDSYNVSRLALAGGLAALGDLPWMRENVRKVVATRRRLTAGLQRLGFGVLPSEANFVLACTTGYPARQIHELLKRKRILVRYYDTPRLRDCIRVSVGTDEETEALLVQIAEIIGARIPTGGKATRGNPHG
ncbi:MAG: histidinol-phosphate transaminase [bacterium]|nr:histidinol-phosphate transaminase [bacterium]